MTSVTNDRVRSAYRRAAPRYDRMMRLCSRIFDLEGGRAWACESMSGRVLELGIGTGLNLPHYRPDADLTAVDLSPDMLDRARARAASLGRSIALQEADMTHLPFPDDHFDAVVSTLTLCTVPDPVAAAREANRVCRRGGELRFFEHGRGSSALVVALERLLQPATLWLEADHLLRDPRRVLEDAGVTVADVARTHLGIFWRVRATPA
jgi:ubiquinone/menaquinone biosynthesis C-methylase UbiE